MTVDRAKRTEHLGKTWVGHVMQIVEHDDDGAILLFTGGGHIGNVFLKSVTGLAIDVECDDCLRVRIASRPI